MQPRATEMLSALALLLLADGVSGAVAHASPYPKGVYNAATAREYYSSRPLEVAGRCAPLLFFKRMRLSRLHSHA